MPFILSKQRHIDVVLAFEQYKNYIQTNKHIFPPTAFKLASSEWYFDFNEPKCPHDGWLETCTITEKSFGERREIRTVSITITFAERFSR